MSAIDRHTHVATLSILRHNDRSHGHAAPHIDRSRSPTNYNVAPDHGGLSDRDYYEKRLSELWHLNRADVNTTAEIIITQPRELPPEQQRAFFDSCERFMEARYGKDNIISAHVHNDEQGQPHCHWMITPEGHTEKHGATISYDQVFGRRTGEFQKFHPELQRWLNKEGFNVNVNSGVTKQNGRAYTVEELKNGTYAQEMEARQHAHQYQAEFSFEY